MTTFQASVQYNDWVGTAAADNADKNSMHDYLMSKKLIEENEFPVGITLLIGENHRGDVQAPSLRVLVIHRADFDPAGSGLQSSDVPLKLRQIDIELTLEDLAGMFKRVSVALSPRGLDITGREYDA